MTKLLEHFPSSLSDWYSSDTTYPFWEHDGNYNVDDIVKVYDRFTEWWPYKCVSAPVGDNKHPYRNKTEWEKIEYEEGDVAKGGFSNVDPRVFDVYNTDINLAALSVDELAGGTLGQYDYTTGQLLHTYTLVTNTASSTGVTTITFSTNGGAWLTAPTYGTLFVIESPTEKLYTAFMQTASPKVLEGFSYSPYARALFNQIMPDQPLKLNHAPEQIRSSFGNGYVQVASKWVNNDLASFNATFSKLPAIDAEAIRNFLKTNNSSPFYFMLPPPDWKRVVVVLDKWDITYDQFHFATLTLSAKEVAGYLTY